MNLASIMLGWIGPWQIVLIVVVILLLFGGRKIPELMRGLGGGIKEFKSAVKEDEDHATKDNSEEKKDDSQSKTT
ncbi:MAG: twin-arginine translocase TatA/TatE family subunit [Schleiferiaceae bacterium]|nr:twin-arginine translocase TatA/TatE family subunit [Schleiferiaceae bacterium]MDR9441677.1 twin-arginine translocase TatA/TatE family subunit [Schleiferiaceae bacterium]